MNRSFAVIVAACLLGAVTPSTIRAQAKPAAQAAAASAPAAPAKWVPPIKGEATVEFTQSKPTPVKDEVQTKIKVRNTSKGSIALLAVEEIWYNSKGAITSNGVYRHKQLINPGDVIEFTVSSLKKPDLYQNMLMFKHANGTIKPTKVAKLP